MPIKHSLARKGWVTELAFRRIRVPSLTEPTVVLSRCISKRMALELFFIIIMIVVI